MLNSYCSLSNLVFDGLQAMFQYALNGTESTMNSDHKPKIMSIYICWWRTLYKLTEVWIFT